MQLVEQGKLDLGTDINVYLHDVHIPATFDKPVTLKSLLTHTPGFEDRPIGLFLHDATALKPLATALREEMPARVRPPDVLASYSNYGAAIAGLVVADVAAKPWEDVVEQTILAPLGMKHTLVRQPAKKNMPENMSKGYKWEGGRYKEGFEYMSQAPAGVISSSAADMSRFLIAHLNDGRYENNRILKPETARRMRERLFAHDPKVDAMCYGFWELHRNGQRILHHEGDTIFFHSMFAMIPAHHVGLFFAYNTDRGAAGVGDVLTVFLNRYFPVADAANPKPPKNQASLALCGGIQCGSPFAHDLRQTCDPASGLPGEGQRGRHTLRRHGGGLTAFRRSRAVGVPGRSERSANRLSRGRPGRIHASLFFRCPCHCAGARHGS